MTVLAIIPARCGSKGLTDKNIKTLYGHPLIAYAVSAAVRCPLVDTVVVSTDSPLYAEIASSYGAHVPFLRPTSLSTDSSTTEQTLSHALNQSELFFRQSFETVLYLTPTDFFRTPTHLLDCITALNSNHELESSFCCQKTTKNFWSVGENYQRFCPWMKEYSSRQTRTFSLREDTGRACATRASLIRSGKRIGDNIRPIITENPIYDIDIHTPYDFHLLESTLDFLCISDINLFHQLTHGLA